MENHLARDYDKLSSRQQVDASGKTFTAILDDIDKILNGWGDHTSFGTRQSGLDALRKIGESIRFRSDEIGRHQNGFLKQFGARANLTSDILEKDDKHGA